MLIQFKKKARKVINEMDKPTKARIKAAIEGLTLTPPEGDIKQLKGYKDGRMRLRVGQYRIIYRYDKDGAVEILLILDIGARGDIYK
ncbi:MAG: type II toxin-antitoxin system RelE/ParE family toxin [Ruminococcus sp.]|nr:type II toxin-antitoxin system RelE/ParE family toxin [Ruminococcus sp.]